MKVLLISVLFIFPILTSLSQVELEKRVSGYYNPSELVTISKEVSFDEALEMLNAVSQFITGKSIVSTVSIKSPIGLEINRMPYKTALNIIVNLMGLMYEEEENRIVVQRKITEEEKKLSDDIFADTDAREISISAVFFEADMEKSREVGIDWKAVFSKNDISIGTDLRTKSIPAQTQGQQQAIPPGFETSTASRFDIGDFKGNVTAMFRFFETQNLGEIIASPSITVRDKQKGRIQVGSDFSIKQRDFSGNIIDRFYSAGSIIEVVPYVYQKNELLYVLLKISVERSSFFPTELTTEVKKTAAASDVLLLDSEQTVIGGLYVNEENVVRTGIPFLKDLPWWVFGIRYLAGSDQKVIRKKEVIILIKADVLPTLEERFTQKDLQNESLIREKLREDERDMNKHKQNYIQKQQ